jgi:glutamate dehydrogenase (NAD(P)+)
MYDMITGYGCAFSLDEAWKFKNGKAGAKIVIQGFGCVGASMAFCLDKMGYKVVGIADANGFVSCQDGLDVKKLVAARKPKGELDPNSFESKYVYRANTAWLDEDCDILVPAALEDVINKDNVHKVKAALIVEAANIPVTAEADEVLAQKGIDVCVDFVANLGGIRIYEALVFGLVDVDAQKITDDTEAMVRKQTRLIFEEAKKQGKTQRQVAKEIFAPKVFDTPDI